MEEYKKEIITFFSIYGIGGVIVSLIDIIIKNPYLSLASVMVMFAILQTYLHYVVVIKKTVHKTDKGGEDR